MSDPFDAGATLLTYIMTPLTCVSAWGWYSKNWAATGRLNVLNGALKAVNDLYIELDEQTKQLALTPAEEIDVRKKAKTLKDLRNQLRTAQLEIHDAGLWQQHWQWSDFIASLQELEKSLVNLNKDILTTTTMLSNRAPDIPHFGDNSSNGPLTPRAGPIPQRSFSYESPLTSYTAAKSFPDLAGVNRPIPAHVC